MALPPFSLKQLFLSMLLISVGVGGITFSLRTDDPSSATATAARVIGGVLILVGVIPLVTRRRPAKVLILTLCSAFAGMFVAAMIFPPTGRFSTAEEINHRFIAIYGGLVIGSITAILLAAIVPPRGSGLPKKSAD